MTLKVIIFDFDGTIADTLETIVNILNGLSEEFGYKKASQEDLEHYKNLRPHQIIQFSGVSIFKLPSLVRKLKFLLKQEILKISPIEKMKEILIELKNRGYYLGIITSNSRENVLMFLKANDLHEVFDFIYSGTTLLGKSKVLNSFLKKQRLKPEEIVYVGDETRDIDAAKKSHVKVIAVSWGFNSQKVLAEHNPDFLIERPDELVEVIESLQQVIS